MTKKDKLITKFLSKPKDFTWQELVMLLESFGYTLINSGKTSGSRMRFVHPTYPPVMLHKPHPRPILKRYQLEDIINLLKQEGLL
ncbi:MAG: type II toxin-antitoxin system HicA family toxin [Proteobacteria bacterium]|nr:type II toxin-antitoxin system HicA family toxin [Pseudomonadota bacterium]